MTLSARLTSLATPSLAVVDRDGLKSGDLRTMLGQGDQHADSLFLCGAPAALTISVRTVKLHKSAFNATADMCDAFQGAVQWTIDEKADPLTR